MLHFVAVAGLSFGGEWVAGLYASFSTPVGLRSELITSAANLATLLLPSPAIASAALGVIGCCCGTSLVEDAFRSLGPFELFSSFKRFRFLAFTAHCVSASSSIGLPAVLAISPDSLSRPLSASCCCSRNSSSCSDVSSFTACSFARVDSNTESRNSTSSSSRLRN